MSIKLIKSIKAATPYMLRNDGKLLSCGDIHPYIKYIIQDSDTNQIIDLFTSYPEHLKWFYNNTNKSVIKRDIIDFISMIINVNPYNFSNNLLSKLKLNYDANNMSGSQFDIEQLFEKLNDETNQEFCRVRTSNMRYGGTDNSIYFRISSIGFNWFDLIWTVVYNNRNFIETVTICKDTQSLGGSLTFYKHAGRIMSNIPIDDFINLPGNPVFEKTNIFAKRLNSGASLEETFGEYHPFHIRKCINLFKDDYLSENFE